MLSILCSIILFLIRLNHQCLTWNQLKYYYSPTLDTSNIIFDSVEHQVRCGEMTFTYWSLAITVKAESHCSGIHEIRPKPPWQKNSGYYNKRKKKFSGNPISKTQQTPRRRDGPRNGKVTRINRFVNWRWSTLRNEKKYNRFIISDQNVWLMSKDLLSLLLAT